MPQLLAGLDVPQLAKEDQVGHRTQQFGERVDRSIESEVFGRSVTGVKTVAFGLQSGLPW